jgi:hypothetical protein
MRIGRVCARVVCMRYGRAVYRTSAKAGIGGACVLGGGEGGRGGGGGGGGG